MLLLDTFWDISLALFVIIFFSVFSLLVTHLKLEGHADISHNELVLLQVDTKLDKGELDARGGVIAGAMLVENIQAHGERKREIHVIITRCMHNVIE